METLKIRILPNGNVEVEVENVEGMACAERTKSLEQALGTVSSRNYKPEFYAENTQTVDLTNG